MSKMELVEFYNYYWNQQADPRTNNLPFVGSPFLVPSIILTYLYIVLKAGPEYMKNRKPYNLKTFAQYYDVFQIIANAYLVHQYLKAGWFTEVWIFCEPPNYSYAPGPLKMSYTMWLTMLVKLIDLIETVMFVLRKKDNQVSFLHLYHHVSTLMLSWITTKYTPVAMVSFTLFVNCGVHVVMYTYYLLSTFGEKVQKMINPFKPLITMMQMGQFIILIMQNVQALSPYCPMNKLIACASLLNLMMNFALFYNFYQTRYKRHEKSVQKTK